MRISITSEKAVIDDLQTEIIEKKLGKAEKIDSKDQTELAFGIGEVGTIITILKSVVELVQMLIDFKSKLKSDKQKIYLKTALGSTMIELSKDVTYEELVAELNPLMTLEK